jgi:ankyrin repeat protein
LSEAVLVDSESEVKRLLNMRLITDECNENIFRQSALHIGVTRPQHLKALLDSGFDVNARDLNGRTPLMYAARCGSIEASIMLLKAGADIWLGDYLYLHHDFLHIATRQHQWNLVMEVLEFVRGSSRFSDQETQSLLDTAIVLWAESAVDKRSSLCFKALLGWGANPNITFDAGYMWSSETETTLLHRITDSTDIDALLQSGFSKFNQPNSRGVTPLMVIVERSDPVFTSDAISNGCCVSAQDHNGRTALHVSIEEIWEPFDPRFGHYPYPIRWSSLECTKTLLRNKADPSVGDCCRCACTTSGCTPGLLLLKEYLYWISPYGPYPLGTYIWSLEYLQVIEDINGLICARKCLLEMIRLVRFEELELTHTCCQKRSQKGLWQTLVDENDIDEIMDEEKDIIQDLEQQMAELEKYFDDTAVEDVWIEELQKLLAVRAGRYPKYLPPPRKIRAEANKQGNEVRNSNLVHNKS